MPPSRPGDPYAAVGRVLGGDLAPLLEPVEGMAGRDRLHFAFAIPRVRRGSGGHNTIFQIISRLEGMGHTCSIWLHDPLGDVASESPGVIRRAINDHFAPVAAPVLKGFEHWYGADVAVATGWQTVYPVMLLDSCRARAYLVNDHEPEFYPSSFERQAAARTYELGLHCIAASPWLRDLLAQRYGATARDFPLGVDDAVYWPRPVSRCRDTVIFYGREVTPRRGVRLGTLALDVLLGRHPRVKVWIYGDRAPLSTSFPYEHLGVLDHDQLADAYSRAGVGLSLSLTNFSLTPKEMLACGLPCVEVAGVSAESIFGDDGPIELAPPEPTALADALERLLLDGDLWSERSIAGREWVSHHSWDTAARAVEGHLREALRIRERSV